MNEQHVEAGTLSTADVAYGSQHAPETDGRETESEREALRAPAFQKPA